MLRNGCRPRGDQCLDQVPVESVASHDGSDRHVLRIGDELAGHSACEAALESDMGFEVAFVAVATHEPGAGSTPTSSAGR
jgi:hypothetical protein